MPDHPYWALLGDLCSLALLLLCTLFALLLLVEGLTLLGLLDPTALL